MLSALDDAQDWDLLHSISSGTVHIADVYQRWNGGDLKKFKAEREAANDDPDLEPYVERWHATLVKKGHKSADKYLAQLRTLIPSDAPFFRSAFRRGAIRVWLDVRPAKSRNRYRSAASSFAVYLREHELLEENPVLLVRASKPSTPRVEFLSVEEAKALLALLPLPHRALHAFLLGTGADVGAALQVRMRDVDEPLNEAHVQGTKTHTRDRTRKLMHEWAADVFWSYVRSRPAIPTNYLFEVYEDSGKRPVFDATLETLRVLKLALATLAIKNYATKDHRHTFAVLALKDGFSYQVVAHQLGHLNTALVISVYGKFVPQAADYTRRTAVETLEVHRPSTVAPDAA